MKDTRDKENENYVAAIMKSNNCFALGPRTFKVIKEYDLIFNFLAIDTNLRALMH
tara:strand:- start:485 stop:649 length:165 start_codon:yes stop_codon:yes gene_type:complete